MAIRRVVIAVVVVPPVSAELEEWTHVLFLLLLLCRLSLYQAGYTSRLLASSRHANQPSNHTRPIIYEFVVFMEKKFFTFTIMAFVCQCISFKLEKNIGRKFCKIFRIVLLAGQIIK